MPSAVYRFAVCFNPRTHMGCDLLPKQISASPNWFQSTHPHGVRRSASSSLPTRSSCFNPRTHMGCDPPTLSSCKQYQLSFNPRTHMGCDFLVSWSLLISSCFNPRTHMGCDFILLISASLGRFQSTHPHGVRRSQTRIDSITKSFNPRTHMGCDWLKGQYVWVRVSFNPRTHMGCDFLVSWSLLISSCFNPRTHMGCDWSLTIF